MKAAAGDVKVYFVDDKKQLGRAKIWHMKSESKGVRFWLKAEIWHKFETGR